MFLENELFTKYDLLVPSKFDGGYLIIAIYEKIKRGQLTEVFTTNDIRITLEEISSATGESLPQTERIIKNLLHYFLRVSPSEYGKYYLTDYAIRLVELISNKINNPYKNYPLKESFDKYFTTRFKDLQSITDLELKFGSGFVAGHKQIINDHLEALEDELNESYTKLNEILHSDEKSATALVKKFADIFKKFGLKAEDISNAIASKDRFLRLLRERVDQFYNMVMGYKQSETEQNQKELEQLRDEWRRATAILKDLDGFFQNVDHKIENIRKQIINASDKLSELHENFASHSNFRLNIKKMLGLALDNATYSRENMDFKASFPLKEIVQESTRLFYPEYYLFDLPNENKIIEIERDVLYELEKKSEIEKEIKSQEIISKWVSSIQDRLKKSSVDIKDLMEEIVEEEGDPLIAVYVAIELTQLTSKDENLDIEVLQELQLLTSADMYIWKMKLQNKEATIAS
jgi:hypothetical protein